MKTAVAAGALIAVAAAALMLDVALLQGMTKQLHMNDFGKFYYSARAYLDGGDMYASSPATDLRFVEAPDLQFLNMNPPHFHLVVLPLARLDPESAVTIWVGLSILALVVSLLVIGREAGLSWTPLQVLAAVAGSLAFAATQSFFITGQLSLLLLLPVTIAWASARRGRWTTTAVVLGVCASVKPFLLIFAPYLLLTRRLRELAILLVATAASAGAGVLIFGASAYQSWYRALGQSGDWAWAVMNASTLALFRRAFGAQPIGTPIAVAPALVNGWLVAAAIIGVVTLVVAMRDRGVDAVDRAFALLLVAAQLISPLGWIYYLWLPAGPLVTIVKRTEGPAKAGRPVQSRSGPAKAGRHVLSWDGRHVLLGVAAIGFVWPMPYLLLFRNHAWGTLTIGSIYFWATFALWCWLLADHSQRSIR